MYLEALIVICHSAAVSVIDLSGSNGFGVTSRIHPCFQKYMRSHFCFNLLEQLLQLLLPWTLLRP
jgi:hypothetical protein